MRRVLFLASMLCLAAVPGVASAQQPAPDGGTPPSGDEPEETGEGDEGGTPQLRPPEVEAPDVGAGDEATHEPETPSPADASAELEAQGDHAATDDATQTADWGASQPVFTLHGYFRVRGELQDTFYLDRVPQAFPDLPFEAFRPIENGVTPDGGCGSAGEGSACDTTALKFANMRLRLMPQLNLSDDVRVKMWIDVLDNVVLGSTPDGLYTEPNGTGGYQYGRSPFVPLQAFATSQVPPQFMRNSLSDSIYVRRAWAEVRNRGLGELRFGRMGSAWGLGILANGGETTNNGFATIDSDYSSDVDRIMGITKLAGFYLIAAWDFAAEGFIHQQLGDLSGLAYDAGQRDDVDQFVFAVARRMTPEDQETALQRGDWVLNGGVYFVYRNQLLTTETSNDALTGGDPTFIRRGAEAFIPDLWGQFLWRKLRLEAEAVMIAGSIENVDNSAYRNDGYKLMQFGAAFEGEYRLFEDKLGIYLNMGFTSGDQDVEGLTLTAGLPPQQGTDRTISTFRMHPNYRIDLILWRTIMRQIAGAYYFRPGVSYDFIRGAFGQMLGARVDLVYSRASSPVQTWGNDADLGVELDGTLYYRSEDGPEIIDGFYAMLQYGILFPMKGLGYLQGQTPAGDLSNAQTVRFLLGVNF